jgi:hypothetical protein
MEVKIPHSAFELTLTPALSLRERENGIQHFEESGAGVIVRHLKKQKARMSASSPRGRGQR